MVSSSFVLPVTDFLMLHRRLGITMRGAMRDGRNVKSTAGRIMILLVESGFLYSMSGVSTQQLSELTLELSHAPGPKVTTLVGSMVRLPFGTLGDICIPLNAELAVCFQTSSVVAVLT